MEALREEIKVFERLRFPCLVAKDERGVIGGKHRNALHLPPLPPDARDLLAGPEQVLQGDGAQRADRFGPNRPDLPLEVRQAGRGFLRKGGPVPRRTALDDVGDVDALARKAEACDPLVEPPPGGPHERLSLPVFLLPGSLADEHQPGAGVAHPENNGPAPVAQRAAPARKEFLPDILQGLRTFILAHLDKQRQVFLAGLLEHKLAQRRGRPVKSGFLVDLIVQVRL
jgi:hypothetical protein